MSWPPEPLLLLVTVNKKGLRFFKFFMWILNTALIHQRAIFYFPNLSTWLSRGGAASDGANGPFRGTWQEVFWFGVL